MFLLLLFVSKRLLFHLLNSFRIHYAQKNKRRKEKKKGLLKKVQTPRVRGYVYSLLCTKLVKLTALRPQEKNIVHKNTRRRERKKIEMQKGGNGMGMHCCEHFLLHFFFFFSVTAEQKVIKILFSIERWSFVHPKRGGKKSNQFAVDNTFSFSFLNTGRPPRRVSNHRHFPVQKKSGLVLGAPPSSLQRQ